MNDDQTLAPEQVIMERRFALPYNWLKGSHTRHIRQKNGIWAAALGLAGSLTGKKVIDAGCGDGWYSARMHSAGTAVIGIDYSARGVKHAESIVDGAEFKEASILNIPYADETFDVSFSFQVIEHLYPKDVETAARELARVTKKGGKIIVSVPSVKRKMSAAHFQHFTEEGLTKYFAKYCISVRVIGQDRRTPLLWIIERLIENRVYTLERFGTWFNTHIYLPYYNTTTPDQGDNLMIIGIRA